ncbi:hypothetical protein ACLOJK_010041 [Asimina triloba]
MGAMREGRALDGASCTRSGGAGFVVGCCRGRAELTEVAEGAKGADLLDLGCLTRWRHGYCSWDRDQMQMGGGMRLMSVIDEVDRGIVFISSSPSFWVAWIGPPHHCREACRQQSWLPTWEKTMEHHTGAPVVHRKSCTCNV